MIRALGTAFAVFMTMLIWPHLLPYLGGLADGSDHRTAEDRPTAPSASIAQIDSLNQLVGLRKSAVAGNTSTTLPFFCQSKLLEEFLPARRPPTLTSPQLAKAFAHPTRVHLMAALNERITSPSELANDLGEEVKHVAYHVKKLVELGCVELVRAEPTGGGRVMEHFYRTTQRPYVDAAAWDQLADNEKQGVVTTIMRLISEDVADAQAKGTFYDPDDNHISRTPVIVDSYGWREVVSLLDRTVEELFAVQARVNARRKKANTETMLTKVEIIQFRSPDIKKRHNT